MINWIKYRYWMFWQWFYAPAIEEIQKIYNELDSLEVLVEELKTRQQPLKDEIAALKVQKETATHNATYYANSAYRAENALSAIYGAIELHSEDTCPVCGKGLKEET